MKKSVTLLLIGILFLSFSCQNKQKENTPESVTENFVKAFSTGDFPKMFQYSTKKSDILIKDMQTRKNSEEIEQIKSRTIEIIGTTVENQTDSTATCVCEFTINKEPKKQIWEVKKENGEWRVALVR